LVFCLVRPFFLETFFGDSVLPSSTGISNSIEENHRSRRNKISSHILFFFLVLFLFQITKKRKEIFFLFECFLTTK
jgi:hypothetical protein